MHRIKFGTDGWRAVIADGYTFENLSRVTCAAARWLKNTYGTAPTIIIGHDTRFLGPEFTRHAARVFVREGVHVLFAEKFTTTPAISWATRAFGCNAGIVITASHNPPAYNGFKIKSDFGGPASPEVVAQVEALVPDAYDPEPLPPFDTLVKEGRIELRDVTGAYVDELRRLVDIDAIRASGIRVAHDAMYGAGQGLISRLLGPDNVVEIRSEINPGFGGQAPEPIAKNLSELPRVVAAGGLSLPPSPVLPLGRWLSVVDAGAVLSALAGAVASRVDDDVALLDVDDDTDAGVDAGPAGIVSGAVDCVVGVVGLGGWALPAGGAAAGAGATGAGRSPAADAATGALR